MAQEDMILSLANNALKANPELVTKLTTALAGSTGSEVLKNLAANPVFQTVAKQLVTTEAFQQFIMKLATSEIGKTIVVNGAKFIVTQEMQNGLGSAIGGLFGGNCEYCGECRRANSYVRARKHSGRQKIKSARKFLHENRRVAQNSQAKRLLFSQAQRQS